MRNVLLFSVLLLGACGVLGKSATAPTPPAPPVVVRIAPPTPKQTKEDKGKTIIVAIPCVILPYITFSMPRDDQGQHRWRVHHFYDPSNKWDTTATVIQIRRVNTIINSICGGE